MNEGPFIFIFPCTSTYACCHPFRVFVEPETLSELPVLDAAVKLSVGLRDIVRVAFKT